MNCNAVQESLTALLDEELAEETTLLVETHLATCALCRSVRAEEQAVRGLLTAREKVALRQWNAAQHDRSRDADGLAEAVRGELQALREEVQALRAQVAQLQRDLGTRSVEPIRPSAALLRPYASQNLLSRPV